MRCTWEGRCAKGPAGPLATGRGAVPPCTAKHVHACALPPLSFASQTPARTAPHAAAGRPPVSCVCLRDAIPQVQRVSARGIADSCEWLRAWPLRARGNGGSCAAYRRGRTQPASSLNRQHVQSAASLAGSAQAGLTSQLERAAAKGSSALHAASLRLPRRASRVAPHARRHRAPRSPQAPAAPAAVRAGSAHHRRACACTCAPALVGWRHLRTRLNRPDMRPGLVGARAPQPAGSERLRAGARGGEGAHRPAGRVSACAWERGAGVHARGWACTVGLCARVLGLGRPQAPAHAAAEGHAASVRWGGSGSSVPGQ